MKATTTVATAALVASLWSARRVDSNIFLRQRLFVTILHGCRSTSRLLGGRWSTDNNPLIIVYDTEWRVAQRSAENSHEVPIRKHEEWHGDECWEVPRKHKKSQEVPMSADCAEKCRRGTTSTEWNLGASILKELPTGNCAKRHRKHPTEQDRTLHCSHRCHRRFTNTANWNKLETPRVWHLFWQDRVQQ